MRPIARCGASAVGGMGLSIATLALAIGALGCVRSSAYIGEWAGRRDVPVSEGQDPYVRETLANLKLAVRKDGTFTLREDGFEKAGVWTARPDGLTLEVRETLGRRLDPSDPMAGKRTLEAVSDTLLVSGPGYGPVVLRRSKPENPDPRMP